MQTQPILAGLVWGPALAASLGAEPSATIWARAVATLAPLIASIGDRIFYLAVPLCLGSGLVVLGLHFAPSTVFWYPLLWAGFLLTVAVAGWRTGIRGEGAVLDLLASGRLERTARVIEAVGRGLLGLACGWLLASAGSAEGWVAVFGGGAVFAVVALIAWVRGLSPRARFAWLLVVGAGVGRWLV